VERGYEIVVVDNLSTGFRRNVPSGCRLVNADLLKTDLDHHLSGAGIVYHLAANADVRFGWQHPTRDLEQNLIATVNVAESARRVGVERLVFSSTGSVYGESAVVPTPEDAPFPVQTSLYGASKAAAEGFLAAYAMADYLDVTVFRFVSVLGPRYSHGHVIDFVRQLLDHPDRLAVLGDGSQRKSYMHVDDCVEALLTLPNQPGFDVVNLGIDGICTVRDSIGWICDAMGADPELHYTGGDRGWVGDNPLIHLDTSRARGRGWKPQRSIEESVRSTVAWILDNPWVLKEARAGATQ
jgi:UDP-glucose 4-epimerase